MRKQFLVGVNRFKRDVFGGPDGVRTRDRPVKSRTLYLTKLQAQMYVLGFVADLQVVLKTSASKIRYLKARLSRNNSLSLY